jgi:lysozyme
MTAPKPSIGARAAWPVALSAAFIAAILAMFDTTEQLRLDPYYDSVGVLTVCRGLTNGNTVPLIGRRIVLGERWTRAECEDGETRTLNRFNLAMRNCTNAAPLLIREHFALLHFGWNVGIGNFCTSTIATKLRARDYTGLCDQLSRWVYAKGRDCRVRANNCYGLVVRREVERTICNGALEIPGLPDVPLPFGSV